MDLFWSLPFYSRGIFRPLECAELRLRGWMEQYADLELACYLDCRTEAAKEQQVSEGVKAVMRQTGAKFCHLTEIKSDIDKQLSRLPRRWAFALLSRYRDGYETEEVGVMLGVTSERIGQVCRAGIGRMARKLAQK